MQKRMLCKYVVLMCTHFGIAEFVDKARDGIVSACGWETGASRLDCGSQRRQVLIQDLQPKGRMADKVKTAQKCGRIPSMPGGRERKMLRT